MNNPFYISSHAANKLLTKQMITTNNLANMSTIGFKAKNVLVINKLNNNSLTKYPNQQYFQSYYDLTEGSFINTKQPLDLIIRNKGWFVVQDKKNFKEYYTRNGHLHVNSDGYLSIQERLILGDKGPIKLPKKTDLKITRNGDVVILKKINNKTFEQKISKLKIAKINTNKMIQDQQGMFYTTKKISFKKYRI
ncbi:flagellar hook-basal body complex protein [Buchnera aphidicola (Hormaphis cornu)]|nr:flagellar hook-basal body complex protein [Buchnera aphidicola (Hormaphis cornu)]